MYQPMQHDRPLLVFACLTLPLMIGACDREPSAQAVAEPAPAIAEAQPAQAHAEAQPACWDGTWQISGALREINLHGRIDPTTTLAAYLGRVEPRLNHVLGSIGGLSGEYTLWDETMAIAKGGTEPVFALRSVDALEENLEATFIFGTHVPAWTTVELPAAMDLDALGDFLGQQVEARGVDGALPFRVQGVMAELEAHVVDAASLPEGGGSSCGQRKEHAYRFGGERLDGRVVGIFTTAHTSVIVDHTTSIHAHVMLDDERSGHIDTLVLPAGATVQLPAAPCK